VDLDSGVGAVTGHEVVVKVVVVGGPGVVRGVTPHVSVTVVVRGFRDDMDHDG
jgi:hypothetical protein